MEVERITVKVEAETLAGKTSVEASATLDYRESRSSADAAQAAFDLSQALRDALEAAAPQGQMLAPPTCPVHQVPMEQHSNERGTWWSHQDPAGGWCKGKA